MAIIVKDGGGNFEHASPGQHQAVCTNVYGPFHESYTWQGKTISAEKVVIMFELDDLIKEGEYAGKRFTVSERFTTSLGDKSKLRPFLESWRGLAFTPEELTGFDLEKLIGANCTLNLIEKDKKSGGKSIVIGAIMPMPKGTEKMVPELPRDHMPKWIKAILDQNGTNGPASQDRFEDDIPF